MVLWNERGEPGDGEAWTQRRRDFAGVAGGGVRSNIYTVSKNGMKSDQGSVASRFALAQLLCSVDPNRRDSDRGDSVTQLK